VVTEVDSGEGDSRAITTETTETTVTRWTVETAVCDTAYYFAKLHTLSPNSNKPEPLTKLKNLLKPVQSTFNN
jgi:hypothetical protein